MNIQYIQYDVAVLYFRKEFLDMSPQFGPFLIRISSVQFQNVFFCAKNNKRSREINNDYFLFKPVIAL
jgi:hypothetical protein